MMIEVSQQDLQKDFVDVMSAATDMQAVLDSVGKEHQLWFQSKNRFCIRLNRSNKLHLMNQDPLLTQDLKYRYYEIVTMQQFHQIVFGYLKYYENNFNQQQVTLPEGDVGEWENMEEGEAAYESFQMIKLLLKQGVTLSQKTVCISKKMDRGNYIDVNLATLRVLGVIKFLQQKTFQISKKYYPSPS